MGTPRASTKAVAEAAREFAVLVAPTLENILVESEDYEDRVLSNADTVRDVCLDLALMAEDLLSGGFLWRIIEDNNTRLLGSPLPLVVPFAGAGGVGAAGTARALPAPDSGEAALDARRFQFFLFTVFSYWVPSMHAFPDDEVFVDLAERAARFFRRLRGRAVSSEAFLMEPDNVPDAIDGAGVKRKLVWLGCESYLSDAAFRNYMARQTSEDTLDVAVMDDFLCQECTRWSGLGALEILADALRLDGQDRADLLGWDKRHAAVFRVESMAEFAHPGAPDVPAVLLALTNTVNRQRYETPMFMMTPSECPFKAGMFIFGMLARWRGVWRWTGAQEALPMKFDAAAFRREFILTKPGVAYRYCPDLLAKARESEAREREFFLRFYGNELVLHPDGLAMAAGEQRRMREACEARAAELGVNAAKALKKHGNASGRTNMPLPEDLLGSKRPVALFYAAGVGVEMAETFDAVLSGLRKTAFVEMSDEERDAVSGFVESNRLSPEFVRRVARDEGSDGIVGFYCGDARGFDAATKQKVVEYLLRRYKGERFRGRFPNVSVMPGESSEGLKA